MTKKLHYTLGVEGATIRLDVNGNTVREFTIGANQAIRIIAREVAFFEPDTRLEVYLDGTKRLDYTVPPGFRAIIETELLEDE